MRSRTTAAEFEGEGAGRLGKATEGILGSVLRPRRRWQAEPLSAATQAVVEPQLNSVACAGGLALPPGPLGMLTLLPDLAVIGRIQSQLVADIAGCFGRTACLRKETLLPCLFQHGVASLGRDLLARVGQRVLARRVSLRFFQDARRKVGVRVPQRLISRGPSRWLPLVGAGRVATCARFDTGEVGESAIELFSSALGDAPEDGHSPQDRN